MFTIITYLIYLTISLYITLAVGKALNKNGLVFLTNHLDGNQRLANAINQLLLIGYYLINIGYILLVLNLNTSLPTQYTFASQGIDNIDTQIRFLSMNIGLVSLMLGAMHMIIFYVLANWKPVNAMNIFEEQ